ncbi:sugar phosphate isomerase/epimerase [Meridianimarinicoccus roseus]|jgi:sugar phosphate isomerase/epimerase|uniref:Sugar phosphate isomerase/epimerase n=1 Tax=Meridianimarinicoccus roseus TaxID=2072018 RepID=A0A2V2LKZ8_9RHOB|nr:sugar phosphate isomerase/epimerase family protein [Meridianimarinicoccus roseus]PWR04244.1 sugar phosphate isomerase/epimerase [Meridianimarinicoccus roseus]
MLELSFCNELLDGEGLSLREQAELAVALGYAGLELAPATLGPEPHRLDAGHVADLRRSVEATGARITGLHWLLSGYPGLSITDRAQWDSTRAVLIGLVDLCARLGGRVLVHGSPGQRPRPPGLTDDELTQFLADFFAPVAEAAQAAGVVYCIEPLARQETATITTIAEAAALVEAIDLPAFRTMIDCKAAGLQEPQVSDRIRDWVPTGLIGHIHANDTNLGAPGMGNDPFHDIVRALVDTGWSGTVGVEPFRTCVDARITAAIGIATLRSCERALA